MSNTVFWHDGVLTFKIDANNIQILRQFLTTVDNNRATKSLFSGEVILDWQNERDNTCLIHLHKVNGEFTYEELEGLLCKIRKILTDIDVGSINNILRQIATTLPSSRKIFLPKRTAPFYCVHVDNDTVHIDFLSATNIEEYVKKFSSDLADIPATISFSDRGITVSGYVGKCNTWLPRLVKCMVRANMCAKQEESDTIQRLNELIVHDLVSREIPLLEKLTHKHTSEQILNYRDLIKQTLGIFTKLTKENICSLNPQEIDFLKRGCNGEHEFNACPPIVKRSFERLATRLPSRL